MNSEQYLADRLEDQINWYDKKSLFNQRLYKCLRAAEIICAALIPFLSGYISIYQFEITLAIGFLGVVITVIAGFLSLYRLQENWVEYRTTCESLKKEKYLYLTESEPYNCEIQERMNLLVHRVENLISKENTSWSQYMAQAKPPVQVPPS